MNSTKTSSPRGERLADFLGLSIGLLSLIFPIRVIMDSSFRMAYTFIPQISAGLKLGITAFGWLLTIRVSSALLGPVMGVLADRYGRRNVMAFGLLSNALGMGIMALVSGWWAAIPMFLTGLAINAFMPAQQAYISDQSPFNRRGRALASVDIAFAIAGMVVMPLVGWVMSGWGWRLPFVFLSALSLVAALVIWTRLPVTEVRSHSTPPKGKIWGILKQRNVLASVGVAALLFTATGIYMTFWSIWLSADYGYGAVDLGLVATSTGVAELGGAIIAGLFIDRIGKRRGSLISLAAAALVMVLMSFMRDNLIIGRVILVLLGFWIEMSIVSLFPLYGEQAPEARATVFALVALGNGIGLAIGSPLTTALWEVQGLGLVTGAGALSLLLAFGLVFTSLRDQADPARSAS